MKNTIIHDYIKHLKTRYTTGIAREHSYRGDLQTLVESLNPGVLATNEPARIACGAPDFILTRNNIPVGYVEAKDIGVSLAKIDASEQLKRYKASLDNLILTDYCEFWFYRNGKKVGSLAIAEIRNGTLVSIPEAFQRFTQLIQDFCLHVGQTITSAQKLAEMMAGKAKMMQVVIESALKSDEKNDQNSTLHAQMKAFQKILIHDITPAEFADIYAQTLAYGMFAARLHDPS
ncbi:adenine methyltransferase, partial [candidate division KSB3 bacterium]|nr:adenine methyltransferase [candidate division KSB3 bacterium]MBD3326832.1 adenine methyltransferase [candidate division KSB3 bacterium]